MKMVVVILLMYDLLKWTFPSVKSTLSSEFRQKLFTEIVSPAMQRNISSVRD